LPQRDKLTGLLDGQNIEHRLRGLIERSDSPGPLGIILVDLGGLRNINAAYGREAGDLVLRNVAMTLEDALDGDGLAFRLGGDAFIVLLPGCGADQVAAKEKVLEAAVSATTVEVDGRRIPVTGFTGKSVYPDDAETPKALIRVADRNLKAAKPAV
jgi:diguanylate cyclase (GGDEF)-like protein